MFLHIHVFTYITYIYMFKIQENSIQRRKFKTFSHSALTLFYHGVVANRLYDLKEEK